MSRELEKQLQEIVNRKNYERCSKCSNDLAYIGGGTYECKQCGNVERNNYGKIRHFLDDKGEATIPEISQGTGLRFAEIEEVIRNTDVLYDKKQETRRGIDLLHSAVKTINHKK